MFQRLRATEWAFDIALAGGVAFFATFWSAAIPIGSHVIADILVITLTAGGVAVRRASPPIALIAVSLGATVQMASGGLAGIVNVGQLLVLYACAAFGTRRMRRISFWAAIAGALVAAAHISIVQLGLLPSDDDSTYVVAIAFIFAFMLVVLVCAWLLGFARYLVLRAQRASVAQRIAEVQAEAERERVAVEHERGRVAREMHDVLAHSLVSIAMLADGTRVAVRTDPDEADDLARTIGDIARESVADVRRLLAELRHGQSDTAAPTIAELPSVIGRVESLGLRVDRVDHGEPQPLTPGASLAVYRVVSECLTNALRHGDTAHGAKLELTWRDNALRVIVRNRLRAKASEPDAPGRGSERPGERAVAPGDGERVTELAPIPSGGHGLIGIRERVLLEAGTIDIRPDEERDGHREFVVDVVVPTGTGVIPTGTGAAAPPDSEDEPVADPQPAMRATRKDAE